MAKLEHLVKLEDGYNMLRKFLPKNLRLSLTWRHGEDGHFDVDVETGKTFLWIKRWETIATIKVWDNGIVSIRVVNSAHNQALIKTANDFEKATGRYVIIKTFSQT